MIEKAKELNVSFLLPVDNVAADKFDAEANTQIVGDDIPDWLDGARHRPEDRRALQRTPSRGAKTVVWNGPMGCFEMPKFSERHLRRLCKAVAEVAANGGVSIIGGGDSCRGRQQEPAWPTR